jgi:preprotein translocase subunit SecG
MLLTIFNVVYVLVALGMTVLILLQRGAGAQAGSGFGGGASGTVFGARGATTFLSRATGVLAGLFFVLSLVMAIYLGHSVTTKPADDLGIMSGVDTPAPKAPEAPAATGDVPAPAAGAPAADTDKPAPAAANDADKPVPAPTNDAAKKDGDKKAEPEKH